MSLDGGHFMQLMILLGKLITMKFLTMESERLYAVSVVLNTCTVPSPMT